MTLTIPAAVLALAVPAAGPHGSPPVAAVAAPGVQHFGTSTAPPRYFLLLFGSDAGPLRPGKMHTWATYVKACPVADGSVLLEPVTISWLPADLRVKVFRPFRPEPGVNLGLGETIAYVTRNRERIALWGPYETDAGRYEAAVSQAGALAAGAVRYRAVDSLIVPNPGAAHCVRAVTEADPGLAGRRQPIARIGRRGTARVADELTAAQAIPYRGEVHDWLIPALGLDGVPIERRR